MAIIDLPQTRGFLAASFTLGLDVNESGFRGFYTGNQQTQSTLSDRLTGILTLPPTTDVVAAAAREALLLALVSSGDHLRLPPPQRRAPLGTISGAVTVGANALAGARSITLAGATARPNLLLGGTVMSAAPWVNSGVTVSADAHTDPLSTVTAERLTASTGSADYIYQPVGLVVGRTYTFSIYLANFTSTQSRLLVRRLTTAAEANIGWSGGTATGATLVTGTAASLSASSNSYYRCWVTFVATEADAWVRVYPGNAATHYVAAWGAQIEEGASPTTYAGGPTLLAGDIFSTGGNLLHVGFAGAVGNDAGAITVPLSLPLPKAVTAGAAVSLAPTGLWEWDADAPQFDYSPGRLQGPLSIPLRQVIA